MLIKILIADDHPVVLSGIRNELARHPDLHIVGEAGQGDEALQLARELLPDIVLLDVNMPGLKATNVIKSIKTFSQKIKVIILTAYGDTGTVLGMMKAGASGYILKDEELSVLPEAIRVTLAGETWLSPAIATVLLNAIKLEEKRSKIGKPLTGREQEVLLKVLEGRTNRQIASLLNTTESNIKFHVGNILKKLDLESRVEIILWIKEHGLPW